MQELRSEAKRASTQPEESAGSGAPAMFEEAYVRFAPRLRRVAVAKFGIAPDDAEALVQDVFATFFMHAANVEQVERYLIGGICNAARKYMQRAGAAEALFCGEDPCEATVGDVLLRQIERKQLLAKVFARIGSRCRDLLCRYFTGTRYIALLLLVAVVPTVYAADAPNPSDPPDARILPPIGATSQARILPPIGAPSTDARIHPPGGAPAEDARIKPPTGVMPPEPSIFEQFIDWLVLQARIHPPIG